MTTTTNKSLKLKKVEQPIEAKGPIETLVSYRAKLEEAFKWANSRVEHKQDMLQYALDQRDKIKRDLALTDQIIAQHTPDPRIEILVNNTMQGVVPATSFADRLRATGSVVE